MAKAEVIQLVGDAITTFSEVQCLTPRYLVVGILLFSNNQTVDIDGDRCMGLARSLEANVK